MVFNKLVFAGMAAGCLTAAAGGSYLAVRQSQSASAVVQSDDLRGEGASAATTLPVDASKPVTESEGVIVADGKPERQAMPADRAPAMSSAPATSSRASSRAVEPAPVASSPRSQRSPDNPVASNTPAAAAPSSGSMWETRPSVQPSTPEYREADPPAPAPPPAPEFVELTVPSDAVLGLQIERTVSSELARVEDKVDARVTRDLRVSDRIAIPAGSTVR